MNLEQQELLNAHSSVITTEITKLQKAFTKRSLEIAAQIDQWDKLINDKKSKPATYEVEVIVRSSSGKDVIKAKTDEPVGYREVQRTLHDLAFQCANNPRVTRTARQVQEAQTARRKLEVELRRLAADHDATTRQLRHAAAKAREREARQVERQTDISEHIVASRKRPKTTTERVRQWIGNGDVA